jgi:hypothetical protein
MWGRCFREELDQLPRPCRAGQISSTVKPRSRFGQKYISPLPCLLSPASIASSLPSPLNLRQIQRNRGGRRQEAPQERVPEKSGGAEGARQADRGIGGVPGGG